MAQYRIVKIVYGRNMAEAVKNEPKGEVVVVELNESISSLEKVGFK